MFDKFYGMRGKGAMKKPKPKKIRKVWAIKPGSRVQVSRRKELIERARRRDARGERGLG